jgi:hypothetical protein
MQSVHKLMILACSILPASGTGGCIEPAEFAERAQSLLPTGALTTAVPSVQTAIYTRLEAESYESENSFVETDGVLEVNLRLTAPAGTASAPARVTMRSTTAAEREPLDQLVALIPGQTVTVDLVLQVLMECSGSSCTDRVELTVTRDAAFTGDPIAIEESRVLCEVTGSTRSEQPPVDLRVSVAAW